MEVGTEGGGGFHNNHDIIFYRTPSMSQRPVLGSGSSANVATVPLARNF